MLKCPKCSNAKDMSNSDIRAKGKWTAIPCKTCTKKVVASKWFCVCGIPWLKCPVHFASISQCFNKTKGATPNKSVTRPQRPAVVGKLGDPFVKKRNLPVSKKRIQQFREAQCVVVTRAHIPPRSRDQPIPIHGPRKRPPPERDKPLIKRVEYGPKASILSGSKIAQDLLQRGLLRKELLHPSSIGILFIFSVSFFSFELRVPFSAHVSWCELRCELR